MKSDTPSYEVTFLCDLYKSVDCRQKAIDAPMLVERVKYLSYWKERGCPRRSMLQISRFLIYAIMMLPSLLCDSMIDIEEIHNAADRWSVYKNNTKSKIPGSKGSKRSFIWVVTGWVQFMKRLTNSHLCFVGIDKVEEYLLFLKNEKGYSVETTKGRMAKLRLFMRYLNTHNIELANTSIHCIEEFLEQKAQTCNRLSIATYLSVIKDFIRYCIKRNWTQSLSIDTIVGPRQFSLSTVPSYIPWDKLQLILKKQQCEQSKVAKRNRAILLLLAVYGLRASEVANLRISDINWRAKELNLYRAKRCRPQIMPLVDTVAQALIEYILNERNNSVATHFLFQVSRAPYDKLSNSAISNIASIYLRDVSESIKHHGAHCLRHTCATHLINTGYTLKEIADVLGHSQIATTCIYSKVDFQSLKNVSDMNWGGLL